MKDAELLAQTQHVSDVFTKIMLKTMTMGLLAEAPEGEITMAQLQAMKHIAQHGSCTIGSLAEGLGVTQPAATMLVDRMVKRGVVEREPGRNDRRQAEVRLTRYAKAMLEKAESERADRLSKVLGLMSPGERQQFLESLQRFVGAALKLESAVEEACLRCGIEHRAGCVVNQMHLELTGADVSHT